MPADAQELGGLAVGLDNEAEPVDDQRWQRQMVEQETITFQRPGNLGLGLD